MPENARGALLLIANPNAGRVRSGRALTRVLATLQRHGFQIEVAPTESLDHARALARAAPPDATVAALGGDGLIGALAGELAGSDRALAILPGGRGNDLARKLGIGQDFERACAVIANGRKEWIDLALIRTAGGSRTFLGIASAGIDSEVQDLAARTRIPLKRAVYAYSAVRALAGWQAADFRATIDGTEREFRGYSVAAANSGIFGGGIRLAPDASLCDGLLDFVVLGDAPKARFLANLPRAFRGGHVRRDEVCVLRGRELYLDADRPLIVYADGEPVGALPVRIGIVPRSLQVIVP